MKILHIIKNSILIFGILFLFASCSDDDITNPSAEDIINSLELNRPAIILNDLAKGEFNNGNLTRVQSYDSNVLDAQWNYQVNVLGKVSKIVHSVYNSCEQRVISFYYNESNLIREVVSIRTNHCNEFTAKWVYLYNYETGLLTSITGKSYYSDASVSDKLISVSDNYFSYYSNGLISKIYSNGRPEYEPLIGFNEKKLVYDNDNNVVEVSTKEAGDDSYYQKFTFEYDEIQNPYKGFYINTNIQTSLPNVGFESTLGPNFLSNNFIKKVTIENLSNSSNQEIKYFYVNANNGLILDYQILLSNDRTYLDY